jgi:ZIP family zinc transporter
MVVLQAAILGLAVGVSGTVLGGLLVFRAGNSMTWQSWLLGLSGGVMAAVVVFDLWGEAWRHGGFWYTLAGNLAGVGLIVKFETLMNWIPWYRRRKFAKTIKLGLLLGMGIGFHNFPEGVALGATYAVSRNVREWLGLAIIMAAHNLPEGMVITSAFRLGKLKTGKILMALIMVELPMLVGGGMGAFLGKISGESVALALGFAGGAMLFLVGQELLPLAKKLAGVFWVGSGFGVGFLIGAVLVQFV